ncbi:MAG: AAA family ATPase [Desulfobulbaceae bacterium]|nr:AAA family ATPase [Desulfobulbaceae bacterium]
MSIIAVYNIKGGVGKTATSVNLSYLSASRGEKTLLCDMDPQGSASYYFRIRAAKKFNTTKLLKGGKHIDRNIKGTDFPGLDLLPADFSYRNIDIALDDLKKSQYRIRKVLLPMQEEYDRIFLDCPPNITLLSENIFYAADRILVPVIPTTLSLLALEQLFNFLDEVGQKRSKVLVFFSMVEKRKKMHLEMMQLMKTKKGVLSSAIPYLADVEKMGVYRQPVTAALPRSVASEAYRRLWAEILSKLRQ